MSLVPQRFKGCNSGKSRHKKNQKLDGYLSCGSISRQEAASSCRWGEKVRLKKIASARSWDDVPWSSIPSVPEYSASCGVMKTVQDILDTKFYNIIDLLHEKNFIKGFTIFIDEFEMYIGIKTRLVKTS